MYTGFIQASSCKIQGLLKYFPTVFKDLKLIKNTGLHIKILLRPLLKILVLENQCKIMVPLIGAAYVEPNKGTTILY